MTAAFLRFRAPGQSLLLSLAAVSLSLSLAVAQKASTADQANLPTAKAYAAFAWPPEGALSGDEPGALLFTDFRGPRTFLKSYTRRGNVAWDYSPGSTALHILVAVPSPVQEYQAAAALLGFDRERNAYIETVASPDHPDRVICIIDPAGTVKLVTQAPGGLWKPGAGTSPFSPSANKPSPSAGLILGDDRTSKQQKQGISYGKVSWTYNDPTDEPSEIRVVLIKANGDVRSPHAGLEGFDHENNAYIQIHSDIAEFDGHFYRIDSKGMPAKIDALPPGIWKPTEPAAPAAQVATAPEPGPKAPVVRLSSGKYTVTFTDPDTNQPVSEEMEAVAVSKDPERPLDGLYHNEKHMVSVRDGEVTNVQANRIPMGFKLPAASQP